MADFRSGDPLRIMRALIVDGQIRTCSLSSQSFSLEFKKIGPRKWLHDTGPRGLCNIVKIYELSGQVIENSVAWSLTETRVSAGHTTGICDGVTEELNKPTVWGERQGGSFELPCDFVNLRRF